MKHYIEAYAGDGSVMLGNLDGQGVIYARSYKRTMQYKRLIYSPSSRVFYYRILKGLPNELREVEIIYNDHHYNRDGSKKEKEL